jgi:ribosomal-protein-alanine N-acetyltransferase
MPFEIQDCSNLPSFDLTRFLNANNLSFNNLDWFSPDERFNEPGCFAIIEGQQIKALLAATPECPTAAWLRFFYAERNGEHPKYLKALLSQVKTTLLDMGAQNLFSLAPYDWLERLLTGEGFKPADIVVTLQCNFEEQYSSVARQDIIIREMTNRDMAAVEAIDIAAFDPSWQLNRASLTKTYHRSSWHSVALLEGKIVGYQMSTSAFDSAHLARLAVDPRWQRRGVGHRLVEDMFETFSAMGVRSFSVNTQASNVQSLSLYQSLGFEREDRDILVMSLTI